MNGTLYIIFFADIRKLKNRVAAQTARDRKKERMGQLEEEVQLLLEQNRKLQEENEKLKHKSSKFSYETA